jgi:hypothetical protein
MFGSNYNITSVTILDTLLISGSSSTEVHLQQTSLEVTLKVLVYFEDFQFTTAEELYDASIATYSNSLDSGLFIEILDSEASAANSTFPSIVVSSDLVSYSALVVSGLSPLPTYAPSASPTTHAPSPRPTLAPTIAPTVRTCIIYFLYVIFLHFF